MSDTGGGVTLPKGFTSTAVAVIVVLAAAFTLSGTNGKVEALSAQVSDLEVKVEHLADIQRQIDDIDRQLAHAQAQVKEIEKARDEIVTAICRILGRSPSTCGVDS